MGTAFAVRLAGLDDAAALAATHVACWRETYFHLLSAAFLAGLNVEQRQRLWQERLAAPGMGHRCVVGVVGELVVGFAMSVPSRDDPPVRELELAALYVRAAQHGSGLGQALLEAVVGERPCSLWVAQDNPRARAFYTRNGFYPDGARLVQSSLQDLVEVRLVR